MTGTDLCVNKPHYTCASKCLSIMVTKKNQSRSYLNHLVNRLLVTKHKTLWNFVVISLFTLPSKLK